MNDADYNKRIKFLIAAGLLGLFAAATGYAKNAHGQDYNQSAESFGYGTKIVPDKNTQQYAQDLTQGAEGFGYGTKVPTIKKPIWFVLRFDGGILFPSNAVVVRGGAADTSATDKTGWNVGGSFGASLNHGTIAQVDLNGVINYGRWGATINPGDNGDGIVAGNSQLMESTMLLAEANWRPLSSDKGLIAPFLGFGLGMNIISWLNKDVDKTAGYKKSAVGVTGVFQIGTGFDWFFATNWAIGLKYNYLIPFGKNIEVGNQVVAGDIKQVLYIPSNFHILNAVLTISF